MATDIDLHLGRRLRRRRRLLGLTQAQLAERMGVSPGTVYRWEAGSVTPQRYNAGRARREIAKARKERKNFRAETGFYGVAFTVGQALTPSQDVRPGA